VIRRRFAFGKNWQNYVQHALTPANIQHARHAFQQLYADIELQGKTFLDIGFGQGLALFFAREMGADVVGIDNDADNLVSCQHTAAFFQNQLPAMQVASILDVEFVQEQRQNGQFDVVHAWGVLHHTGNMRQALYHTTRLVKQGGYLIVAIYNKHWSSPIWKVIKQSYNHAPNIIQKLLISMFYPVIYCAKWVVTGTDPKRKERGMDFFYDVVDWVGGYPYEYASVQSIQQFFCQQHFECIRVIPAKVPTGCNQFVFRKCVCP
jgi:2-polyprenyl-6-hydroxyphenyl methylase/3-demethylubiquinone-9 3-methyltransferase